MDTDVMAGLNTLHIEIQNESYFLNKYEKYEGQTGGFGAEKHSDFTFFHSLKGNRGGGGCGGRKKEISEKKMKNIVETELKVCLLSRMKIYIAERKASRQILHPPPPPTPLFFLLLLSSFK